MSLCPAGLGFMQWSVPFPLSLAPSFDSPVLYQPRLPMSALFRGTPSSECTPVIARVKVGIFFFHLTWKQSIFLSLFWIYRDLKNETTTTKTVSTAPLSGIRELLFNKLTKGHTCLYRADIRAKWVKGPVWASLSGASQGVMGKNWRIPAWASLQPLDCTHGSGPGTGKQIIN